MPSCVSYSWYYLPFPLPSRSRPNLLFPTLPPTSQPVGPNDLIAVSVYDAPELSRNIRVGADGYFALPMLKQRLMANGLYPADLETAIGAALRQEQILVSPVVTVSIAEYHSHPISVSGSVKMPLVFQAEGPTTLLEAIAVAAARSWSAARRPGRMASPSCSPAGSLCVVSSTMPIPLSTSP